MNLKHVVVKSGFERADNAIRSVVIRFRSADELRTPSAGPTQPVEGRGSLSTGYSGIAGNNIVNGARDALIG